MRHAALCFVATGPDTKVVRNMLPAPRKVTRLETAMNRVVMVVLAVLATAAVVLGTLNMVWEVRHKPARDWYLGEQVSEAAAHTAGACCSCLMVAPSIPVLGGGDVIPALLVHMLAAVPGLCAVLIPSVKCCMALALGAFIFMSPSPLLMCARNQTGWPEAAAGVGSRLNHVCSIMRMLMQGHA